MTQLPSLLAAVFLGTGNSSSKIVHGSFLPPIAASKFVNFRQNLYEQYFRDEVFMVRNTVKKTDVRCHCNPDN